MTEGGEGRGGSAAMKVLMPAIATLTSALASYVAKKAPEFLEQTLLPRLRETRNDVGRGHEPKPNDELEQRRRERAAHRAARRKAS